MKLLIIHSANSVESSSQYTFIKDQADALMEIGYTIEYFGIKGKGIKGYLKNYKLLKNKIKEYAPDIIHAHYGLSGALASLQRKVPVVITFHNGETLTRKGNIISSLASLFSAYNIFVAQHIADALYLKRKKNSKILPCGIDLSKFEVTNKEDAKTQLGLPPDKINILFGGTFDNVRKNVKLANEAIAKLDREDINLIELKGWTRVQVALLLCACDLMLLTTKSEGSPQIVKEAMACNCPIVATDVADIKYLIEDTQNCYLISFNPLQIAEKISLIIENSDRTNGRNRVIQLGLDNTVVAERLNQIYTNILEKK